MDNFRQIQPKFHKKPRAGEQSYYRLIPQGSHEGLLDRNRVKLIDELSILILQQQGCFGSHGTKEIQVEKRENKTVVSFVGTLPSSVSNSMHIEPAVGDPASQGGLQATSSSIDQERCIFLFLEEAFFLYYAFGCLSVTTKDNKALKLIDFWSHCRLNVQNFVSRYAVYHFYRSKGWVVKSGSNYGVDFVLYRIHPNLFHSSFGVIVIDEEIEKSSGQWNNWRKLALSCRILKNVKKELLLCKVKCCVDKLSQDFSNPEVLKNLSVEEIFVGQWFASKHFSDVDD